MTDITERLAEIEARVEAATEGPWTTYRHAYGVGIDGPIEDEQLIIETMGLTYPVNSDDAEFIAHARADLPWLVEQVRQRDEVIERVRALADEWERTYPRLMVGPFLRDVLEGDGR